MKKYTLIFLVVFVSGVTASFKLATNISEPSKKIIVPFNNQFNHEYSYNDQGVLLSVLTTSRYPNNDSGTLIQKIVFDSTGIITRISLIADTKEENGLVNYSDQNVKFDSNRNVEFYRFTRNYKRVGGKIYDAKKGKYLNH